MLAFLAEVSKTKVPADLRYKVPLLEAALVDNWMPPREEARTRAVAASSEEVRVKSPASMIRASADESWRSLLPEVAFCLAARPVRIIKDLAPLTLVSSSRVISSLKSVKSRESAEMEPLATQLKMPEALLERT